MREFFRKNLLTILFSLALAAALSIPAHSEEEHANQITEESL